jgi:hypothetical protein
VKNIQHIFIIIIFNQLYLFIFLVKFSLLIKDYKVIDTGIFSSCMSVSLFSKTNSTFMIDSSLVDIESVSVRLSRKRKKLKASTSIQLSNFISTSNPLFVQKELQSIKKTSSTELNALCFLKKKQKSFIHCQNGISINSFIANNSNFPQIS